MKFTADIEILDSLTNDEMRAEIKRYQEALEQKEAWDRLTEEEKDKEFESK